MERFPHQRVSLQTPGRNPVDFVHTDGPRELPGETAVTGYDKKNRQS